MRCVRSAMVVLVVCVFVVSAAGDGAAQEEGAATKQFEETSYYLKDVVFIDASVGWAVGDVHWDQAERRYVGTIIKTGDGGETWTPQSAGVDALLNAVAFIDPDNGWAVGANGAILHTADGGATWARQAVDTTDEFRGVAFVDASSGWAVATAPTEYDDFREQFVDWDGSIWHTGDGGATWAQQPTPDDASILHGVDFVDALAGWAVGAMRAGENNFGEVEHAGAIYHTADGGATWTVQHGPIADVSLTAVDFIDVYHGWAVGFPTNSGSDQRAVFHTADSGQTWERQEPGNMSAPFWDVQFIDQDRGYIVGANYIAAWGPPVMRTFDGGATWEDVKMREGNPLSVEGIYAAAVVGDQVVAVGDHDYVAKTTRAWDSCEWVSPEPTCFHCDCLFEQNYINPHYIFHDVFFVDEMTGWAVGSKTFDVPLWGQVILHTADGGQTWTQQYERAPPDLLFSVYRLADVYFADSQTGWAVGMTEAFRGESSSEHYGAVLHTTDGGQTWEDQGQTIADPERTHFFAVSFLDEQTAWALDTGHYSEASGTGNIFFARTADRGATWEWVDTGINGNMSVGFALVQGDVDFPDAAHGWAVGGLGQILHTADGGVTWARQELACDWPTCPKRLFAVEMIDAQTGWIGGEGLYYTGNGGADWVQQDVEVGGDVQDIQFLDAQNGWLVSDDGVLMYTADGGATWAQVEAAEPFAARGLHFVSPGKGWVVGDYGVIVSYEAPASE